MRYAVLLLILTTALRAADLSTITTLGGAHLNNGGTASNAQLCRPFGVSVDSSTGKIYVADRNNALVRVIDQSTGKIDVIAGTNIEGYNGEGTATTRRLHNPQGVCVANGNVYIADSDNNRIRKVDSGGTISTVAGNGVPAYSGDTLAATSASMFFPEGVAVDGAGVMYIADTLNNRIRMVDAGGTITTICGTGAADYTGDNGQATAATLNTPTRVALDGNGHLLIADSVNNALRQIDLTTHVITTIFTDTAVVDVGADGSGNIYVATDSQIKRIDHTDSSVSVVAGDATTNPGNSVDGPATATGLWPTGISVSSAGDLYLVEETYSRLRKISGGNISTLVGGSSGDGGSALGANFVRVIGLKGDNAGNVYLPDFHGNRVRKIDSGGTITTFAGTGVNGSLGDGGPAALAQLKLPADVVVDSRGNVFISEVGAGRIRKVAASDGSTSTFATGLGDCYALAIDGADNIYVASYTSSVVTKITPGGTVIPFAGVFGNTGYNGDNMQATSAFLNFPLGLAADAAGNVFIVDLVNSRIRKVDLTGKITTIAGTGVDGYSGDGIAATSAKINSPRSVAVDGAGRIYIADSQNHRIRKIENGIISTIVGGNGQGLAGDGGPGTAATIDFPWGIYSNLAGTALYFWDWNRYCVRKVTRPDPGPLAYDGVLTTNKNIPQTGTLVGKDGDAHPLTYSIVTNGGKGSANITNTATGAYSYTPNFNASGTDTFTFKVNDGTLDSNTATITVTITALNNAPIASNGTLTTNEDTAKTGTLSASDVDANPLTYTIVANGTKGSAVITNAATGAYTYTPNTDANGADSFTFKANDGSVDSNIATVNVTITPVNDAPVASNGTLTTTEDTAKTGTLSASDVDANPLTYTIVANGTKGSAVITNAATGAYTYTPNTDANGADSFTFKANDGSVDSNIATVNVTITPVNDAPVASNGMLTTNEDTAKSGTLSASDVESDPLSYTIVTNGTKGSAVITNAATGAYTYTPNANANGADSFTFKANDGSVDSNIATVNVTITPVNDAPAIASAASATPSSTTTGADISFSVTGSDVDGDTLTNLWDFGDGVQSSGASVTHAYATPGNFTASVTVSDPSGAHVASTIGVTISAPSGPPVGPPVTGTPGDSDGDGFPDALEIALGTNPLSAADTPFGGAPAGPLQPLSVGKLSIALNFKRTNADSLMLEGTVAIPAGFAPLGQTVVVDVGGVVRSFTLDKTGKASHGSDSFQFTLKKGAATARFTAKFSKAALAATLADEGLTSQAAVKALKTIRVNLLFAATDYQFDDTVLYSANAGKTGSAK